MAVHRLQRAVRGLSGTRSRFGSVPRRLAGFARGAAWFFIVFSLAHLLWVVAMKWENPANLTTLYQSTVGDETRRAFGLAYDGVAGLLLAIAQGVVVSAAAVASTRRTPRLRRAGHAVLLAWALLWFADLLGLAAFDRDPETAIQCAVAGLLFGCTAFRAVDGLRPRHRRPSPPDGTDADPERPVDGAHADGQLAGTPSPASTQDRPLARMRELAEAGLRRARPMVARVHRAGRAATQRIAPFARSAWSAIRHRFETRPQSREA